MEITNNNIPPAEQPEIISNQLPNTDEKLVAELLTQEQVDELAKAAAEAVNKRPESSPAAANPAVTVPQLAVDSAANKDNASTATEHPLAATQTSPVVPGKIGGRRRTKHKKGKSSKKVAKRRKSRKSKSSSKKKSRRSSSKKSRRHGRK